MKACIWLLDDDAGIRDSLSWLLASLDWEVRSFAEPEAFLQEIAATALQPGCLLLDIRMPGMTGLEVLEEVGVRAQGLPVIIITGHADVPLAVAALKAGAFDFVEKPFNDDQLLARINQAVRLHQSYLDRVKGQEAQERLWLTLTPREQEVMRQLVQGLTAREIAEALAISPKTVDVHRHHLLQKMQVRSLAELIHAGYRLGLLSQ
ncbi:response regulator transcription factor [Marinospirillum perlucidum]|uniref:response regulator transcription factor n=1 Tax=Marinospirillum perlucidum TaxID=1982602 RepID=UPI000DF1A0A7|nr:response regulator [Marinospirillum perlucidum]